MRNNTPGHRRRHRGRRARRRRPVAGLGNSRGPSGLTDINWQLSAITEQTPTFQGVVPAAEQPNYAIRFNEDGTYTGRADCNAIAGTYTTGRSNGITIAPAASTLIACPGDSYGPLFAHAITTATTYAIANGDLTLSNDDGATMTFVAATAGNVVAPTPTPTASPSPTPTASPTPTPSPTPLAHAVAHAVADPHGVPHRRRPRPRHRRPRSRPASPRRSRPRRPRRRRAPRPSRREPDPRPRRRPSRRRARRPSRRRPRRRRPAETSRARAGS